MKILFLIVLLNTAHVNNEIESTSYILHLERGAKTNVMIDVEKEKCSAS